MLVTVGIVVAFQAAMFATFTYLQPLTTRVGGISPTAMGYLLAAFGAGSLVGVIIGGAVTHGGLVVNMVISLLATAGCLILLIVFIHQSAMVIDAVVSCLVWRRSPSPCDERPGFRASR